VITIMMPSGSATFALSKFFPAQLKKVLEAFKAVIGCSWWTAIEVLLGKVDKLTLLNTSLHADNLAEFGEIGRTNLYWQARKVGIKLETLFKGEEMDFYKMENIGSAWNNQHLENWG
jgi:hypothetical protein